MSGDKWTAYRWAIDTWHARTNKDVVFNADHYRNANANAATATIMSVDYVIRERGFIMNLCPLWNCDDRDCGPGAILRC